MGWYEVKNNEIQSEKHDEDYNPIILAEQVMYYNIFFQGLI